jgi:hypothetical protein
MVYPKPAGSSTSNILINQPPSSDQVSMPDWQPVVIRLRLSLIVRKFHSKFTNLNSNANFCEKYSQIKAGSHGNQMTATNSMSNVAERGEIVRFETGI